MHDAIHSHFTGAWRMGLWRLGQEQEKRKKQEQEQKTPKEDEKRYQMVQQMILDVDAVVDTEFAAAKKQRKDQEQQEIDKQEGSRNQEQQIHKDINKYGRPASEAPMHTGSSSSSSGRRKQSFSIITALLNGTGSSEPPRIVEEIACIGTPSWKQPPGWLQMGVALRSSVFPSGFLTTQEALTARTASVSWSWLCIHAHRDQGNPLMQVRS